MANIHPKLQTYIDMMPHVRLVFGNKVNLGITDAHRCIWFDLSKGVSSSKFLYKVGDDVPANSLPGHTIKTGRRTVKVIPKEVFGSAVVGVSIPIKDAGKVIGTVTISKILAPGRDRADEREMDFFRRVVLEGRVPEKYSYLPGADASTPAGGLINLHPLFGREERSPAAPPAAKAGGDVPSEGYRQCYDIIYISPAMQEVVAAIRRLATNNVTVLVHGESGTGKELVAHAIHNLGDRSKAHFVAVNCAALPRELIQSELFGYDEGAFTGGRRGGKPGLFEQANKGTIFLDEIGDMDLSIQANLLRVLENKHVTRVGSGRPTPVDVRVIAATNKDLQSEVAKGTFRLDLFYRLKVVLITIPPLRERLEDVPVLFRYFVAKYAPAFLGEGRTVRVSPAVDDLLLSYGWPGNVRELENAVVSALNGLEGDCVDVGHLPQALRGNRPIRKDARPPTLAEVEKRAIIEALAYCGNNISQAAKMLGVTRPTMYRKITQYGIGVI